MARYLDTSGMSTVAVAICDRCKMKRPLAEMMNDTNSPGVRVCSKECCDELDPWRLPARRTEDISLQYPRPDEDLTP